MASRKRKVVRWKALIPLGLLLVLLGVVYLLLADSIARKSLEEAGSQLLGVEVSVESLRILEAETAVELGGLQIADPFDSLTNLVQADFIRLQVAPAPLLEKKVIVRELNLEGLRFRTQRDRPARKIEGDGLAQTTIATLQDWQDQIRTVPLSFLDGIDTLRQLALNPDQLQTVAAARALSGMVDSARRSSEAAIERLGIESIVARADSLSRRVELADLRSLGVNGVRQLAGDVRSSIGQLDSLTAALSGLEGAVRRTLAQLDSAVAAVDQARQRDYQTARDALGLPSLEGPSFGNALFGKVSLGYVQRATYWTQLAMKYLPPGLQPRLRPGASRLRRAGTDVTFPREGELPSFLIERGTIGAEIGGRSYQGMMRALSTAPALVGVPAELRLERSGADAAALAALLDHTGNIPRDSVGLRFEGVSLPRFNLGSLPIAVDPGVGVMSLSGVFQPDNLDVEWNLVAPSVTWLADSARRMGTAESLLWRVVSGLRDLRISASVSGSFTSPTIAVSSNLDQAVRASIRDQAEAALARARTLAREEVDRLIGGAASEATSRAQTLMGQLPVGLGDRQQQVADQKDELEARLRRLTGGLGGILGGP